MDHKTYVNLIHEHFDITDTETRKTLVSLTETSDQNQALLSASVKLYEFIQSKVADIDFGEIPKSRGDITKIPNYQDMVECANTIHTLLKEYRQSTEPTDIIFAAIENMKKLGSEWEKAFVIGCDLVQVTYNTLALSIVSSVSFLISTCIEFIKDPAQESYELSLNTTAKVSSKDYLLFSNLKKFNTSCDKGQMEKSLKEILKASANISESGEIATLLADKESAVNEDALTAIIAGITGTVFVISLLTVLLPIIQELVCFLYCSKQNMSDYFSVQSDIIRLNAENVKLDVTKTPAERDKIYKKQSKIADNFKKISVKLAVKMKGSNKKAQQMVDDEKKNKNKYRPMTAPKTVQSTSQPSYSGIF